MLVDMILQKVLVSLEIVNDIIHWLRKGTEKKGCSSLRWLEDELEGKRELVSVEGEGSRSKELYSILLGIVLIDIFWNWVRGIVLGIEDRIKQI